MRKLLYLVIIFTLAAMLGCGGGEKSEKAGKAEGESAKPAEQSMATQSSAGYQAMEVTNGGTITGTVTFAGAIPARQKLEVTKDVNVCGKEDHYKQSLMVSEANKGLENVVVSIQNITAGKPMATLGQAFELDQHGCEFVPHVTLIPAGQELQIVNSDGILHNIHTYSEKNDPVNMAQPGFKKTMRHSFEQPEVIRIACDVHNWMGGYIVVVGNPYYAKTDDSGNFQLTDVPPGTYTVQYWQETLGPKTASVTVAAGETVQANYEFAPGSASADQSDSVAGD